MVALFVLWAAHGGGYSPDTWYWGAFVALGLLGATLAGGNLRGRPPSRGATVALVALALYTCWSYLSITWASSKGDALEGSNRALLYLLVFALFMSIPWTVEGALLALLAFSLGIGAVTLEILIRLASSDHVGSLFIDGRLAAPTGYFNSSAALFTLNALISVAFATCRRLPALLRGALLAMAAAGLQLSVVGQSRGWLFTLPLVLVLAVALVPSRLRFVAVAVVPAAAVFPPLSRLLRVFRNYVHQGYTPRGLAPLAVDAGRAALITCAVAFAVGTLLAFLDHRLPVPSLPRRARAAIGAVVGGLVLAVMITGVTVATHNHPVRFVERQWNGFSSQSKGPDPGSHFAQVGSQRYDFWRVAWRATEAHPVGGLGQDNYGDYYLAHRRTTQEPRWTHSIELRLLTHTGIVGAMLFLAFLVAGPLAAIGGLRSAGPGARFAASVGLLPLVVWLIPGSVDWFWEVPALTGPALGFLGMAIALRSDPGHRPMPFPALLRRPVIAWGAGTLAFVACLLVLVFPYLAVRELALASGTGTRNPPAALTAVGHASSLDPLSSDAGRIGGVIALESGRAADARKWFAQSAAREPGGWFAWFGEGLADSELGRSALARAELATAAAINRTQPTIRQVLARLGTGHELSPQQALAILRSSLQRG